jgi:hypothetical protein
MNPQPEFLCVALCLLGALCGTHLLHKAHRGGTELHKEN